MATVQSLAKGAFDEALAKYGFVVIDECHHVAAQSTEQVLSRIPARYFLGLTATPKRRDGHQPIMHMQLGPTLFEMSPKTVASLRPFSHRYFVRKTELDPENLTALQARLSQDERRNSFILDDTIAAIRDDRCPLVLCQRQQHVFLVRRATSALRATAVRFDLRTR